jgi:acyl-CoA hydrolase
MGYHNSQSLLLGATSLIQNVQKNLQSLEFLFEIFYKGQVPSSRTGRRKSYLSYGGVMPPINPSEVDNIVIEHALNT